MAVQVQNPASLAVIHEADLFFDEIHAAAQRLANDWTLYHLPSPLSTDVIGQLLRVA
jgi:hypothetical protein